MQPHSTDTRSGHRAFSLVELLVVMAIISLLAAVVIGGSGHIQKQARINLAKAERANVEAALEEYKAKRGVYPPDNLNYPATNTLFYELVGTIYTNTPLTPDGSFYFRRLHGGETITRAAVRFMWPNMSGFINSSYVSDPKNSAQLEEAEVRDYFQRLNPKEYLEITTSPASPLIGVLGVDIDGPLMFSSPTTGKKINPWRYVSSNPTNNPATYDLWLDIGVGKQRVRISNWREEPIPLN